MHERRCRPASRTSVWVVGRAALETRVVRVGYEPSSASWMSSTSAWIDGASESGFQGASAPASSRRSARSGWKPTRFSRVVAAGGGLGLVEREVGRGAEPDDAVDRAQPMRPRRARDARRPTRRRCRPGRSRCCALSSLAGRVEDVAAGPPRPPRSRSRRRASRARADVAGALHEHALGVGVVAGPAAGVHHDDRAAHVAVGGVARDRVGDRRDRRAAAGAARADPAAAARAPRPRAGRALRGAVRAAPRSVRGVTSCWTYRPRRDRA